MSVPAWLSRPEPSAPVSTTFAPTTTPSGPPPTGDAAWAHEKITLCVPLLAALRPQIVERGDAADQAAHETSLWLAALRDHPRHGRNWHAKHGADLRALLSPFFPAALPPEPALEGAALLHALDGMFEGRYGSALDTYYGGRSTPTSPDVLSPAPAREKEPRTEG